MKTRLMAMAVCLSAVLLATGVQGAQDPDDLGEMDSVLIRITESPNAAEGQYRLTAQLLILNDVQVVGATALGFKWVNSNMLMDSARFSPEAFTAFDFTRVIFRNAKIDSTNKYRWFQFSTSMAESDGWAARATPGLACTFYFHLTSWTEMDEVVFDTARLGGATFQLVDYDAEDYWPGWNGPVVVHDPNRPIISNLLLTPDTLQFQSVQGQGAPPVQQCTVESDDLPLAFTLTENVSWLLKSPSSGTTPATIDVSVTPTGLTPGVRFDSIMVASAGAANTPQFLYVRYTLLPPPPRIGVAPTQFGFSAVAGGDNPSSQTLTLSNLGGGTLNWSVSKTQSWLDLAPLSGSGPGTVNLSVDIAGLGFGVYDDVITVTDPAADNSPVEVPVQLTVASDLPRFEVDEQVIYRPVPASWNSVFTRTFEVRNGGGGALAFSATSEAPAGAEAAAPSPNDQAYITHIALSSPTAPSTVTVTFQFVQWADAYAVDTVWLISPDAINSPFPVIFHQRVVPYPAELEVSIDTAYFIVYECSQGYGNSMPQVTFEVNNVGGDSPAFIEMVENSALVKMANGSVSPDPAPVEWTLEALYAGLPLGTHHDSLKISSRWAINSPQWLIVRYEMRGAVEPPVMLTVPTSLSFAWQEDSGPAIVDGFEVWNVYGGCMPWSIQESLGWLSVESADGNVPGASSFLLDPSGLSMGAYAGSVSVVSTQAMNSPLPVPVELKVWKLHGDWNWNGRVTMQDIAEMTNYVFGVGSAPQPAPEVGDCTCDGNITVTDIAAVIDYLYVTLEPVCGNPY